MTDRIDPARLQPARVLNNGFVGSFLVSLNGFVVMTGMTQEVSERYAAHLNEIAEREGISDCEAIVIMTKE